MGVCQISQRCDVAQIGQRIGGRFSKQQPRVGAQRCLPGSHVRLSDEGGFHAKTRHLAAQQLDGGAKHRLRGNDVVARLEHGQTHQQDGRHARAGGNGALSALHRRQAPLKAVHRGVGRTGIGVARLFQRKATCGAVAVTLHKAAGEVQRLAVFAPLAALHRFTHGQGFRVQPRRQGTGRQGRIVHGNHQPSFLIPRRWAGSGAKCLHRLPDWRARAQPAWLPRFHRKYRR